MFVVCHGVLACFRPDNGRTVEAKVGSQTIQMDNRWVVPYNPLLSTLLDCHINSEVCTGIRMVKYIYKYVHKGNDRCVAELREVGNAAPDEIKEYVDFRQAILVAYLTLCNVYTACYTKAGLVVSFVSCV